MVKTIIEEKFAFTQYADGIYFNGKVTALDLFAPPPPGPAQGEIAGYNSGGGLAAAGLNTIDKFPFAVDANATDVGDLAGARFGASGTSSSTHGYSAGGYPASAAIDKFSFASGGNAAIVAYIPPSPKYATTGVTSETSGYITGGLLIPGFTQTDSIIKFPFASEGTISNTGSLSRTLDTGSGQSSATDGYVSGGAPTAVNTINKFPFAVNSNAVDVGDMSISRQQSAGQSSNTHGYSSGGALPNGVGTNIIDKFPFAADGNSTDVGDLTLVRQYVTGQSSRFSGYSSGGISGSGTGAVIDKFSFASDGNATTVGNLTQGRYWAAGQQV
jgi:hypothetical protein